MTTKFMATVTEIGPDVPLILEENVIIIFDEKVPKELHDVAVLHRGGSLSESVEAGDVLWIDDVSFEIYAVGDKVNSSVSELGHTSFNFSGSRTSELPGTVCVEAKTPPPLSPGSIIRITSP